MDLAPYGLADGSRYAFLQTEEGLLFSHEAYQSIAGVKSLDEVEAYIVERIHSN